MLNGCLRNCAPRSRRRTEEWSGLIGAGRELTIYAAGRHDTYTTGSSAVVGEGQDRPMAVQLELSSGREGGKIQAWTGLGGPRASQRSDDLNIKPVRGSLGVGGIGKPSRRAFSRRASSLHFSQTVRLSSRCRPSIGDGISVHVSHTFRRATSMRVEDSRKSLFHVKHN